MQIGIRREDPQPDDNLGPGVYNPQRADRLVKKSDIYTDFARRTVKPFNQDYNIS